MLSRVVQPERQHNIVFLFDSYDDYLFSKILADQNPGPQEALEEVVDFVYTHVLERKEL